MDALIRSIAQGFAPLLVTLVTPSATFAQPTPTMEHVSPAVERW